MSDSVGKVFLPDVKGKFYAKIESVFESAHYLYRYLPDGSDEPLHGHTWKVVVYLSRADHSVGPDGISIDFVPAAEKLKELASVLDHTVINHVPDFKEINPTAEHIAKWFYHGLYSSAAASGGLITKIEVYEGPFNAAVFKPQIRKTGGI